MATEQPKLTDVTYNPYAAEGIIPPWYRSQAATGRKRTNYQMIGGLHIPNEEGVRWLTESYGFDLSPDHSMDASVRVNLDEMLLDEGYQFGCYYAPRRDAAYHDFLAVTQKERGAWTHTNPDGVDEVLIEEHKMKGGTPQEDKMREELKRLGIKAGEFKCFYF
ncbi:hypothetical protein CPB85DRAFT_1435770 [Mucidula mucida]|nr:hypothetical protein CPB85DRAFT_1435770 [Mucidula mucida]